MIEAILKDKKEIMPCSVYLEGEEGEYYKANDVYVGVPVKLGKDGVEEIIKLELDNEEWELWKKSVQSVENGINRIKELGLI